MPKQRQNTKSPVHDFQPQKEKKGKNIFFRLVSKRMAGRIENGVFMRSSFASLIVKNDMTVCPYGWCSGGWDRGEALAPSEIQSKFALVVPDGVLGPLRQGSLT